MMEDCDPLWQGDAPMPQRTTTFVSLT